MSLSFENKKHLRFVITLATGTFGSSNANTITLQGYRSIAEITKAGGQMMGELRAQIFGVSQSDMNSATTLQYKPGSILKNTIKVFAIDGTTETMVFVGNIVNAWADYSRMPEVPLLIQAQSTYIAGIESARPISINGGIDVSIVMKRIADQMGLSFENNNVHTILNNSYVCNSLKEQALELAKEGNFTIYIDDTVMAITNNYEPRSTIVPSISANSGLVGYPTFDGVGVNFLTLFNPSITLGGLVNLVTDVKQAQGEWIANSISHRLEAEKPSGAWFSRVMGNKNGLAVVK